MNVNFGNGHYNDCNIINIPTIKKKQSQRIQFQKDDESPLSKGHY